MRALVVGDNSSYLNWGGRGASMALLRMLAERFEICATVPGSAFHMGTAGFGYVHNILPPRFNALMMHFQANRDRRRLFDYYLRLEELFGAGDFVSHDPEETVQNILRYRRRFPEIGELYRKAEEAELVVVHGEGDLVFTTPPRREALFLLGMAHLGLHLGKKVVFVNALVSDCPVTGRNDRTLEYARRTLSRCDAVLVRDHQSLEYVKAEMPGARASLVPDSLFSWYPLLREAGELVPRNGDFIIPFPERASELGRLDFSAPYICIGGSALTARERTRGVRHFTRLVDRVKKLGYPVFLTENCGADSFLEEVGRAAGVGVVPARTAVYMGGAILAHARLFISGRYHPTILASLGGTPCIFLGSSAHKMASLQRILEYREREFGAFPSDAEIEEMAELARGYLAEGDALRGRLASVACRRYREAVRLPELIAESVSPPRGRTAPPGCAEEGK